LDSGATVEEEEEEEQGEEEEVIGQSQQAFRKEGSSGLGVVTDKRQTH
jgi:hypothetical protein